MKHNMILMAEHADNLAFLQQLSQEGSKFYCIILYLFCFSLNLHQKATRNSQNDNFKEVFANKKNKKN